MSVASNRAGRIAAVAVLISGLSACATWQPPAEVGDAALRARAVTQSRSGVQLSAAVLDAGDSLRMFGTDVTRHGVQPVWIEVRNDTDHVLWLLRSGTDPDYFSALEVAWFAHVRMGGATNERIDELFDRRAFPNPIPARGTGSGILFTNPHPVTRLLNVDLLGNRMMVPFTLLLPVSAEIEAAPELIHQYRDDELASLEDPVALRTALQTLPVRASLADGRNGGEPLNAILIGALFDVAAAASRRGYRRDLEAHGGAQRLFGRPPDFVARKLAQAGAPANWLRVWRAPISYRGQYVFVVQAGRPVGGRFAELRSVDEARLHPDVDEARNLLLHDFMYSGGLEKLAFVRGAGATTDGPGYYTDGRRAVLFMGSRPLSFSDVEILDWEPLAPSEPSARAAGEVRRNDAQ